MSIDDRALRGSFGRRVTSAFVRLAAVILGIAVGLRLETRAHALGPQPRQDVVAPQAGRTFDGHVVDAVTGKPIAGASVLVRLTPGKGRPPLPEEMRHTTDAGGAYRVDVTGAQLADPTLTILVDVSHSRYVPWASSSDYWAIAEDETIGKRPFFETVKLHPGTPIEGRLVTPEGDPAGGVTVRAYCEKPDTKDRRHQQSADVRAMTDAGGRFRLNLFDRGPAAYWICPKTFALSEQVLKPGRRGDLGTITLAPGNTIRGRVLDQHQQPVAGIYVQARRDRDEDAAGAVGLKYPPRFVQRAARTDADGSFTIPGLPAGSYRVGQDESGWAPSDAPDAGAADHRPLPGVFLAQRLLLEDGERPEPIAIQAVPHVVVEAKVSDSKGVRIPGGRAFVTAFLSGTFEGSRWLESVRPAEDGACRVLAPRGLEHASLSLMAGVNRAMRHRRSANDPLISTDEIGLGRLDGDVKGIEFVRYLSPAVVVEVKSKNGPKPAGAVVWASYTNKTARTSGGLQLGRVRLACLFSVGDDGRFRSSGLLPDEEVVCTAEAKGFRSRSATLRPREGKIEELTLVLEPEK